MFQRIFSPFFYICLLLLMYVSYDSGVRDETQTHTREYIFVLFSRDI